MTPELTAGFSKLLEDYGIAQILHILLIILVAWFYKMYFEYLYYT